MIESEWKKKKEKNSNKKFGEKELPVLNIVFYIITQTTDRQSTTKKNTYTHNINTPTLANQFAEKKNKKHKQMLWFGSEVRYAEKHSENKSVEKEKQGIHSSRHLNFVKLASKLNLLTRWCTSVFSPIFKLKTPLG